MAPPALHRAVWEIRRGALREALPSARRPALQRTTLPWLLRACAQGCVWSTWRVWLLSWTRKSGLLVRHPTNRAEVRRYEAWGFDILLSNLLLTQARSKARHGAHRGIPWRWIWRKVHWESHMHQRSLLPWLIQVCVNELSQHQVSLSLTGDLAGWCMSFVVPSAQVENFTIRSFGGQQWLDDQIASIQAWYGADRQRLATHR